ncbi:MAG: hypothetical protein ABSA01_11050 [Anaerolineales bacterium]
MKCFTSRSPAWRVRNLDVFSLTTGPLLSASSKATNWTGTLPSSQDTIIEVSPVGGEISYSLTVSVH